MKAAAFLSAALWLCSTEAHAQGAAVRVTVPAHAEWCVQSQPIDITQQKDADFGAFVFQILYGKLEKAALAADMPSIGVPYLYTTKDVPPPPAPPPAAAPPGSTPTPVPSPAPKPEDTIPRKVFTVCAVVPPTKAAPTQGAIARAVAARDVYAMRCDAKSDEVCKAQIIAAVTKAGIDVAKLDDQSWSIRQAISGASDAEGLVADLSDDHLRLLQHGTPLAPLAQMLTIAAEIP